MFDICVPGAASWREYLVSFSPVDVHNNYSKLSIKCRICWNSVTATLSSATLSTWSPASTVCAAWCCATPPWHATARDTSASCEATPRLSFFSVSGTPGLPHLLTCDGYLHQSYCRCRSLLPSSAVCRYTNFGCTFIILLNEFFFLRRRPCHAGAIHGQLVHGHLSSLQGGHDAEGLDARAVSNLMWSIVKLDTGSGAGCEAAAAVCAEVAALCAAYAVRHLRSSTPQVARLAQKNLVASAISRFLHSSLLHTRLFDWDASLPPCLLLQLPIAHYLQSLASPNSPPSSSFLALLQNIIFLSVL